MVTVNGSELAPADDSDVGTSSIDSAEAEEGRWLDGSARELETYRAYLLLYANREISPELRQVIGASDLVQESLIEAQQSLADFAGKSEEQFLAWLRRILFNNLTDAARHHRLVITRTLSLEWQPGGESQNPGLAVVDPQPTPLTASMGAEQVERLQEAIARLPDEHRQVIHLRNFELLSFEEIGQRLDKAAGTVCRTWYRAVAQLQRELGDSSDGTR